MSGVLSRILPLRIRTNLINKKKSFSKRHASLTVDGLEQVYIDLLFRLSYHLLIILSVVFSDYFSTILGLVRDGSSWSLEPFEVGLTVVIL